MTYKLKFLPSALKEWNRLDRKIKNQFKKKLSQRLENPHVPSDRLRGFKSHYKIKLKAAGYRLAYEVENQDLYVMVITVGKRDRVYDKLKDRVRK